MCETFTERLLAFTRLAMNMKEYLDKHGKINIILVSLLIDVKRKMKESKVYVMKKNLDVFLQCLPKTKLF